LNLAIPADADFSLVGCDILGNSYPALETKGLRIVSGLSTLVFKPATVRLIPNFAWCHRGAGEMQTWFPVSADPKLFSPSFDAKASSVGPRDTLLALGDGVQPKKSSDQQVPRFTFWPQKGTEEWVSYDFHDVEAVKGVKVMWFDDVPQGRCNLPESWRVEVRETADGAWTPVAAEYPVRVDDFTRVEFAAPVRAREIRLLIRLRQDYSTGILEWQVF